MIDMVEKQMKVAETARLNTDFWLGDGLINLFFKPNVISCTVNSIYIH